MSVTVCDFKMSEFRAETEILITKSEPYAWLALTERPCLNWGGGREVGLWVLRFAALSWVKVHSPLLLLLL